MLRAQEEERRRLARDLHDEVNQALTAILLRLQAVAHDAPSELEDELTELKRLVNQAMEELLQLARQLRPSALDDHGLLPAIEGQVRRFAQQTGIDDRTATMATGRARRRPADRRLPRGPGGAVEHRAARRRAAWSVELGPLATSGVELTVRDDGRGFDPRRSGGLGLNGMAERARLVGGDLDDQSPPATAPPLTLRIP